MKEYSDPPIECRMSPEYDYLYYQSKYYEPLRKLFYLKANAETNPGSKISEAAKILLRDYEKDAT